jgi:3-hydroxybutyryl-CoA dehydrogenase
MTGTRQEIKRVGVVGCGVMGAGVAEVCALAGLDVLVAVSSVTSVEAGRGRLAGSLARGVKKAKLTATVMQEALDRVVFTTNLGDLADRQLVIEAVKEYEPLKLELFTSLDKTLADPDAILATNTSSISIARLAQATGRASHVLGMHFFNPVPVLPLVELVGSERTDEQTRVRAESFLTDVLGKQVIRSQDRAGFLVNALLFPYLLSAIRMVESGLASAEVLDRGMVLGCAHPLGPLRLADLVGLDVTVSIAKALYEEFKEPLYAPPPLLLRMVESGFLGRKSGRGFYQYP